MAGSTSHTYVGFEAVFSSIASMLAKYLSCKMLMSLQKSEILGQCNILDNMINDLLKKGVNDLHSRTQTFVNTYKVPRTDRVDGIRYCIFHVYNLKIKNWHDSNDKKIKKKTLSNLKNRKKDTNNLPQIVDNRIFLFNNFINKSVENKELVTMYYLHFHSFAPSEWTNSINKGGTKKDKKAYQEVGKLSAGYDFVNKCKDKKNGCSIDITLDYIDIKQYWIELFVTLYLDFGINYTIYNISRKNGKKLNCVLKKMEIDDNNIDSLIESYSDVFDGKDYIKGIWSELLLNNVGIIPFDSFYLFKGYELYCYGNPAGMAGGQHCLFAKIDMQKDHSKLSYWCWTLHYDDLW